MKEVWKCEETESSEAVRREKGRAREERDREEEGREEEERRTVGEERRQTEGERESKEGEGEGGEVGTKHDWCLERDFLRREKREPASSATRAERQVLDCSRQEPKAGSLNFQTARLKERMGVMKERGVEIRKEKERGREKEGEKKLRKRREKEEERERERREKRAGQSE